MTEPHPDGAHGVHRRELRRMISFFILFTGLGAATYAIPDAEAVQPWVRGEPMPLVHLITGKQVVQEDFQGALVVREAGLAEEDGDTGDAGLAPAEDDEAVVAPATAPAELKRRPPGEATYLEVPAGAMDGYFTALARVEAGEPGFIARALHWGDSTIAADGITGTVRRRLRARFGDGGPGFMAVHVDPRWQQRPGVVRTAEGDWSTKTITFGGAGTAKYGLGGIVSTATGQAASTLGGRKVEGGCQLLHHFDIFYMSQPGGGTLYARPAGAGGVSLSTAAEGTGDRFHSIDVPEGAQTITISASGADGPVTVFGVAMETEGPGITWETLGVAGAGQGSMFRQNASHVARQVGHREPHLLVYMSGGNELGYPTLVNNGGAVYKDNYLKIMRRFMEGAPEASCLVVTPLDQAERVRGEVQSKPMLERMVNLQRQAAYELGCAFWDARHAMGGDGGFARFLAHDPPLAWSDLNHLTNAGLDVVGNSLADALLFAFDRWKLEHPDMVPEPYVRADEPDMDGERTDGGASEDAAPADDLTPG